MKTRAAALVLALLMLSACSSGTEEQTGMPPASLLGQAAELGEELALLTVDGREVPAWRYLYWLAFTCDQIRARYDDAGLTLDWESAVNGGTLGEYAKEQALADTALYATVENWAERFGCVLTEAERADLSVRWAEQAADHGGEEAYLEELAKSGLDRLRAEEMAEVGTLYAKLCQLCLTEGSDLWSLAGAGDQDLTVDRILISAGEDREGARERAAEVFSQLNQAEDPESAFSALAAEGDDPTGPRSAKDLAPSLAEAAEALTEGQFSGILESEEGFSILRRLAAEGSAGDEAFDRLLQAAAGEALIRTTADYEKLDTAAFDRALSALREEEEPAGRWFGRGGK